MKLLYLYLLLLFNAVGLLKATIVEIEELYNPHTNQTIILMGDLHTNCQNMDNQIKTIVEIAKKSNVYTIIESHGAHQDIQDLTLLPKLYDELTQNKLSVDGIEFRVGYPFFLKLEASGKYKTFQEVYNHWHKSEIKNQIFDHFLLGFQNRMATKNDLESYVSAAPIESSKYIEFIKEIVEKNTVALLAIWKDLPTKNIKNVYDHDAIVDYIFTNTFIKKPNGEFEVNPENIIDKLFDIDSDLLEALVIKNIHKNKHLRVLFIVLGQTHTERVGQFLQNSGFILKNKESVCAECTTVLEKLMAERTEYQEGLPKIPEQYCLDLNHFFKQIEPFPKNNKSFWSKVIYIPNLILSSIYSINSWLQPAKH